MHIIVKHPLWVWIKLNLASLLHGRYTPRTYQKHVTPQDIYKAMHNQIDLEM
jgi:hypothetical protein